MNSSPARRQVQLWFYLGVPLLIGFFLGWAQVGRTAEWPKLFSLLYWFGISFGSLFFLECLTPPFAAILRPRGAPLWLTLVIAQLVIGWVAILPVMRLYTEWLQSFLPVALAGPLQDGSLATVLQKSPTNIVAWVSVNLLFFYALGMERFGYRPPARSMASEPAAAAPGTDPQPADPVRGQENGAAAEAAPASPPAFLSRVREDRRGALLALQADGHYLHVHTDAGSDLILYRLGDALAELTDQEGMRVHRSWWVAGRAITARGDGDTLLLVNGMEVPVSRSYRVQARERGWLG